ncbi:MAG: response regulator [Marinomonas sp.]
MLDWDDIDVHITEAMPSSPSGQYQYCIRISRDSILRHFDTKNLTVQRPVPILPSKMVDLKPMPTTQSPHILIIDDERDIRRPLAKYLGESGYRVSDVENGREMDRIMSKASIDLIVLDVMMPGEDGFSICKRLQATTRIPIILLTALKDDTDRIVGLELGADDYVSKPFNPRELKARIKTVLRRTQMLPPRSERLNGTVRFDRWQFDLSQKQIVGPHELIVPLSSGEHALLLALIEHAGTTLSRDQLLDLTRGVSAPVFDRRIDNQISRLRHKLEKDTKNPMIIQTKWGGGYVFAAELVWS